MKPSPMYHTDEQLYIFNVLSHFTSLKKAEFRYFSQSRVISEALNTYPFTIEA